MLEPLAIFELAQLVGDTDQHVGIGADAEPATGVEEFAGGKNAVAEARFGDGAETGNGAGLCERGDLLAGRVGCVDEAPASIYGGAIQQPLYRPLTRPGQAIL